MNNTQAKGNGRKVILAVFAVFLLPVLLAMLMQSSFWSYRPGGSKAHGKLLEPVVGLPELRALIPERQQWWLVTLDDGRCEEICQKTLVEIRQQRKASGRHMGEVALLYLSPRPVATEQTKLIRAIESKIRLLADRASFARIVVATGSVEPGQIWLLDRELNLFMHYPAGHDASGIRKDLKRILTWAQEKPE